MSTTSNAHSPFTVLGSSFELLCQGPAALGVDGAVVGAGLPAGLVPLSRLRELLLDRSCPYELRDAALGAVLTRAQDQGGVWLVGAAGMLLPGLRRMAAPLVRAHRGDAADIEADMLAGLIAAIRTIDPAGRGLAARLVWAARRAAEPALRTRRREVLHDVATDSDKPEGYVWPRSRHGHPDVVLARAVSAGVLCADDAELIGATRFGQTSVHEAARARGVSYAAAAERRRRAEKRLALWLTGNGFVETTRRSPGNRSENAVSRSRGGRPRLGIGVDGSAPHGLDRCGSLPIEEVTKMVTPIFRPGSALPFPFRPLVFFPAFSVREWER